MDFVLPEKTTEEGFNDLMADLWSTWHDTPAEIYITPEQYDFMKDTWIHHKPITKSVICEKCGYSHDEVFGHEEVAFKMEKGMVNLYSSDFGNHVFKLKK